ncbi:hypothetical protein D3C87_1341620 [compost metagenome]
MRKFTLAFVAIMSVSTLSHAEYGTTQRAADGAFVTTATPGFSTYTTGQSAHCGFDACKEILEAREDMNYFVATGGQYSSVRVEGALAKVREMTGDYATDNLSLASSILADIN